MKKEFKYLFKRIWYYYILKEAFEGKIHIKYNPELGKLIRDYEIISHPIQIGESYYKCLIIKL